MQNTLSISEYQINLVHSTRKTHSLQKKGKQFASDYNLVKITINIIKYNIVIMNNKQEYLFLQRNDNDKK